MDIGKLKSTMNSYGVDDGTTYGSGIYPDMFKELDRLAKEFADEFNRVHKAGTDKSGAIGQDFFIAGTGAQRLQQKL